MATHPCFPMSMRAAPTQTFYVPDTGTSGFGGWEGANDTGKRLALLLLRLKVASTTILLWIAQDILCGIMNSVRSCKHG